jgi:DNA-binding NarL/FixJ family response regulator
VDDLSAVCVLEVDDGAPWRRSVAAHVLGTSVQVVGTAVDGLEAVQKARVLQPDIIVMDIWMPKLDGFEAIREIGTIAPASKILIVSNERHPFIVKAATAAGARGYVLKSLVGIELLTAVEAIVRGDLFIGRGLILHNHDIHRDA